jgi:transcription initiation factor TFIID subunit 2
MVRNAVKFNGVDSEVGLIAAGLRARTTELLANAKAGPSKKRKDGESDSPQPLKKPKMAGVAPS